MKRSISTCMLALAITTASASNVAAQVVISSHTTGTASESFLFVGQSLTTPGGAGWNGLTFTFFRDGGAPSAGGLLFMLTSEYTGTPAALSGATTGFVAGAAAIGNSYIFAPSITIAANTQYFFYTNTDIFVSGANSDTFAGGQAYAASDANGNYVAFSGDANFELKGTTVAPEPSSFLLVGAGLVAVFARRRIRR